jgi:hypothetical protein
MGELPSGRDHTPGARIVRPGMTGGTTPRIGDERSVGHMTSQTFQSVALAALQAFWREHAWALTHDDDLF